MRERSADDDYQVGHETRCNTYNGGYRTGLFNGQVAQVIGRLLRGFTLRPVGIANPCVFDKPLMPRPAVWTVGAAEKYRGAAK